MAGGSYALPLALGTVRVHAVAGVRVLVLDETVAATATTTTTTAMTMSMAMVVFMTMLMTMWPWQCTRTRTITGTRARTKQEFRAKEAAHAAAIEAYYEQLATYRAETTGCDEEGAFQLIFEGSTTLSLTSERSNWTLEKMHNVAELTDEQRKSLPAFYSRSVFEDEIHPTLRGQLMVHRQSDGAVACIWKNHCMNGWKYNENHAT